MSRKHWPLLIQLLLFLLVTVLSVATGIVTNNPDVLPGALAFLRRGALPLAGVTVLLIIAVMVWQHRTEDHLALPARPFWDRDRSPFPGLEAFAEEDSGVFFGRDAEITELVERLHPVVVTQANRLIAVVGPSGVGKSSLVQAGVVPRLRQRRSSWIVVPPVVPGDHPLRSLARSLAAASSARSADELPGVHFADKVRTALGRPSAPVLVIVDQAEELITLAGPAERDAMLDLLAGALETDSRLWIIVIMRSEFLTAFLGTGQARLFRDPVAVGTLGQEALVEVIEQPAQRAGLSLDPPALPQRMAADAGGGDALPLLAYALQELCLTAGSAGVLTADAYQRIGGVTGVLTRQADKVTTELGGVDGPVLPTLLMFVTIGENEPTRRRVRRNALTEEQWRIAEAFIAARLLTSHTDGGDAILEVAHEALFRHWAPLQQAIEASVDQLRWRADLERWARDWENSGRQDAYLLRAERLKAVQRWANSDGEVVDGLALVAEFLACSYRADHSTMEHLSETIARQALVSIDSDPEYSMLLALAAYKECAGTPLALRALTTALVASHLCAVLRGHDDWVLWVAWSPDGQRLATASADHTARIWDAESGAELVVIRGHNDEVRAVAWSPDGLLVTTSDDGTARVWDADSGTELVALRGHKDEVRGVAWSPDGQRIATASRDRTARIWDASSARELATLCGHDDEIRAVAWSPDSQWLATGSHDRTVRIWNGDDGTEVTVLHGHEGWVQGVAWSPDGQWLAAGSHDRTIRIWDAKCYSEVAVLHGHDEEVRGLAWSPDGRRLATASIDRTSRIWDADAGSELMTLRGHASWVRWVAWSPDGRLLATASDDRTARIWDTGRSSELAVMHGHTDRVHAVAWSPDGQRLSTVSADATTRIWDAASGDELGVLRGHEDGVRSVAWSPDGRRLATASHDRTTRIWEAASGRELAVLRGHGAEVRGVAWSPDSQRLASASRDRTIRIWDAGSGRELVVLRGHGAETRGVAWSPDGRQLVTASNDRTARIWDAGSGSEFVVLHGHDHWVGCVAWSPINSRLATGSRDRTIRVWDVDNGSEFIVMRGHDGEVGGLDWSPDGRHLVTGSADGTVGIWKVESGAEIMAVGAHAEGVDSVAWSPDGRRIASASQDGTCRIWDATITVEDLLVNARRRVSRELTAEERRNLMLPPIGD